MSQLVTVTKAFLTVVTFRDIALHVVSKPSHCQDDKPLYSYFSSQLDKDFTHEPNIYLYFWL